MCFFFNLFFSGVDDAVLFSATVATNEKKRPFSVVDRLCVNIFDLINKNRQISAVGLSKSHSA